jgi:hypothetical protein
MMQGARPSSSTKGLIKVNMPSTFFGLGKTKGKIFFDGDCRAPLHEECPQHHGHKGDPGVTPRAFRTPPIHEDKESWG